MKDFLNNSTCKSPPSLKIFSQASPIILQLFNVGLESNISSMRQSVSSPNETLGRELKYDAQLSIFDLLRPKCFI